MPYDLCKISKIDRDAITNAVTGILCDFTDATDQSIKIYPSLFTPPLAPVADVYLAIRQWRDNVINGLNNKVALSTAPQLEEGATIPAAPAPAAATPAQIWQQRSSKLKSMQDIKAAITANGGTPNATFTTDITALAAQVAATYASGF